jgi:TP901 family phage tail tape measure protein
MSYAISYDIKFNNQFSAVAKTLVKVAKELDKVLSNTGGGADMFSKNLSKAARAAKRLDKNLSPTIASIKTFDTEMEDTNSMIRRMIRSNEALAKSFKTIDNAAKKASKSVKKSVGKIGDKIKSVGDKMQSLGRDMTMYVSAPIAGAGIASMKMAADFETAMVEVQKVTDKTVAKELSGSIRKMTSEIPMAHEALAGITADAARFGVRGTANLENFTRSVAKMTIATDLSAEFAGEAFAKIQAQTGASVSETENLGSAINSLSNNYATSADEIVRAVLRSGSAASNFGLSTQEVLAMSAQMNAMSESAERAGTRMRTLFMELQDPNKVKKYAKAIGMTSQQFEMMRRTNANETVMLLVEAMAEGGKASKNLAAIAGGEARQALVALSKNIDATRGALVLTNEEWAKNLSLGKEFDDAVGTSNARMKLFWNRIKDIAITVGNKLIPIVSKLIKKYIIPWVEKLEAMDDAQIESIINIGAMVAAIGPLLFILGKVASVVGMVSSAVGGAGGMAGVLAALSGPVGWTIAAVVALIAVFALFWDELKIVRDFIYNYYVGIFNLVAGYIKLWIAYLKLLASVIKYAFAWVSNFMSEWERSSPVGAIVVGVFRSIGAAISAVVDHITVLWHDMTGFFNDAAGWLNSLGADIDVARSKLQAPSGELKMQRETLMMGESKTQVDVNIHADQGTTVTGITQKSKVGMPAVNVGSNTR